MSFVASDAPPAASLLDKVSAELSASAQEMTSRPDLFSEIILVRCSDVDRQRLSQLVQTHHVRLQRAVEQHLPQGNSVIVTTAADRHVAAIIQWSNLVPMVQQAIEHIVLDVLLYYNAGAGCVSVRKPVVMMLRKAGAGIGEHLHRSLLEDIPLLRDRRLVVNLPLIHWEADTDQSDHSVVELWPHGLTVDPSCDTFVPHSELVPDVAGFGHGSTTLQAILNDPRKPSHGLIQCQTKEEAVEAAQSLRGRGVSCVVRMDGTIHTWIILERAHHLVDARPLELATGLYHCIRAAMDNRASVLDLREHVERHVTAVTPEAFSAAKDISARSLSGVFKANIKLAAWTLGCIQCFLSKGRWVLVVLDALEDARLGRVLDPFIEVPELCNVIIDLAREDYGPVKH